MSEFKIYIPKALAFQRLVRSAVAAASQVDQGTEMNDAHAFALLEFFEFLAPEQLTPLMGPGLAAEFNAIVESEFAWDSLCDRTHLQNVLCTHASLFAVLCCYDGKEKPRCYRRWLRLQKEQNAASSTDRPACLIANFEVALRWGRSSAASHPKLELLKYRIATRTAELLLAAGFKPETTLRRIRKDDVPKPAEFLAMQAFVLLKKGPDDLARVCAWADQAGEAAFLCWASRDSFVGDALVAWRWLKPIAYDQFPDLQSQPFGELPGPLYAAWKRKAAPANLALREEPWAASDADKPFPCLLPKDVKPRFSPVPVMLIGESGVGKSAFLCAVASYLSSAHGQAHEGMYVDSSDLHELWSVTRGKQEFAKTSPMSRTAGYTLFVRDVHDPEVARWMRLRLIDHRADEISQRTLTPELLKDIRAARGLLFLVDDRYFSDLLPNHRGGDTQRAAEIATRYTRVLQAYFDVNKDALHLPVGLVVTKADLLLGPTNFSSLDPPFLIPDGTKMELIHGGLHVQAEAADPFERLRSCIRYNLAISRNSQNQQFIFELIERLRSFIAAVMCHTYRFQIFLTSSVVPKNGSRLSSSHGAWEVIKWMVTQLDQAYRVQANESVGRACTDLEEMRSLLRAAAFRDHAAHNAFLRAVAHREQVTARVQMHIVDRFLENRIRRSSEEMQAALQDIFVLAKLPVISETSDPPPFALRRRSAEEALERVDYLIAYLKEWQERLSGVHDNFLLGPKTPRNEVIHPAERFTGVQRAS